MAELRTSPALLRALAKAMEREPTADEIQRQRVSFIMGAVKSEDVTKSRIQEVLAKQDGVRDRN